MRHSPFHKECPACIRQPHVRQAILRPSDWPGQRDITIKQLFVVRGPRLKRLKETAGAAPQPSPAQPSPAQPSPAQPSPPLPSPTPSTSTCSRLRPRQEARAQDYGKILSGRWLTNAAGMAGRGAGVEGMGCVTAGPALVGLCCTQETTSGAVPAQQHANCSKEPTVKASASTPYSLPSA